MRANLMRLTPSQTEAIQRVVRDIAGDDARLRIFGSRLDDDGRGGDVDLMVELPEAVEHPAALTAKLAARLIRALEGRDVDVLLLAPNLRHLPIHDVALREGRLL